MESLLVLLSVIGLFIVRIGVPVGFLIIFGWIVEKWQQRREGSKSITIRIGLE